MHCLNVQFSLFAQLSLRFSLSPSLSLPSHLTLLLS